MKLLKLKDVCDMTREELEEEVFQHREKDAYWMVHFKTSGLTTEILARFKERGITPTRATLLNALFVAEGPVHFRALAECVCPHSITAKNGIQNLRVHVSEIRKTLPKNPIVNHMKIGYELTPWGREFVKAILTGN